MHSFVWQFHFDFCFYCFRLNYCYYFENRYWFIGFGCQMLSANNWSNRMDSKFFIQFPHPIIIITNQFDQFYRKEDYYYCDSYDYYLPFLRKKKRKTFDVDIDNKYPTTNWNRICTHCSQRQMVKWFIIIIHKRTTDRHIHRAKMKEKIRKKKQKNPSLCKAVQSADCCQFIWYFVWIEWNENETNDIAYVYV